MLLAARLSTLVPVASAGRRRCASVAVAGAAVSVLALHLGFLHHLLAVHAGTHREKQLGEFLLALGLGADGDTGLVHQRVCVLQRQFGHRGVELLGAGQVDVAALDVDVGVEAQGRVVRSSSSRAKAAVLQLDGEAHRHEACGGFAEVLQHGLGHLLGDERVEVRNLAGK